MIGRCGADGEEMGAVGGVGGWVRDGVEVGSRGVRVLGGEGGRSWWGMG